MSWLSDDALARLRSAASAPDLTGTRYRLLGEVGRGGMSTVFLAEDPHLGRRVALKVLDVPDESGDLAERLTREARVLARLEHPGIAPVHDVGRLPDGRVFYAMKYVEGPRLDAYAASTASLPERLRLFQRIVEAVAFAHDRGVLHRDLKPENVMVGPFGEVLVMDWGLAKVLDGRTVEKPGVRAGSSRSDRSSDSDRFSSHPSSVSDRAPVSDPASPSGRSTPTSPTAQAGDGSVLGTPGSESPDKARGAERLALNGRTTQTVHGSILGTPEDIAPEQALREQRSSFTGRTTQTGQGSVLGTPGYMAPEQARGEIESLDARSDVYALGAVLHYLLTRRIPGRDVPGIGQVPRAIDHPSVPRPLLAVCGMAMAERKEDRYPDALALGADVARYLDGRRVHAYPEGPLQKAVRLYARHKVAFWLIVTYLLVRGSLLFFTRR